MNDYVKIVLQADPSGMVQGFRQAEGAVSKFVSLAQSAGRTVMAGQQMWDRFGQSIQNAGKKMLAGGIAGATGILASVKSASTLQTQMKNVQSLTKASDYYMSQQTDAILEMSNRLPQSATTLASGLYDIASSGFEGADGLKVLEASATAASAGLTTTEVASKAIVATLNAYGMGAEKAADVSDILFQGVNVGVMTFDQLAGSMGDWVGMAAQVGVTADEGTAAIAAMTLAGISAGEAGTYLSRMMEAFIQPSENMKAITKSMGYASAKALLDAKGLGGALLELNKKTGGSAERFQSLFGSIQATRGALAIISNDGKNWARSASAITSSTRRAGAAQAVYKVQSESLAVQFTLLKNNLKTMLISIGRPLLAPFTVLVGWMAKLVGWINKVMAAAKGLTGAFAWAGTIGSAIMIAAGAFATFFPKIVAARVALMAFRGVMNLMTGASTGGAFATMIANLSARFPVLAASASAAGSALKKLFGLDLIQQGWGFLKAGALAAGNFVKDIIVGNLSVQALATSAMGGIKGAARTGASSAWSFITSGAGVATIAIAALTAASISAWSAFRDASDAGKEMGNTWAKSLDKTSLAGVRKGMDTTQKEIKDTEEKLKALGQSGKAKEGTDVPFGAAVQGALLGWLPFSEFDANLKDISKYQEYRNALEKEQKDLQSRNERLRAFTGMAGGQIVDNMYARFGTKAPKDSSLDFTRQWRNSFLANADKDLGVVQDELSKGMDAVAQKLGMSGEGLLVQMDTAMRANRISIDDIMDPKKATESLGKVVDYMQRMQGMSVNEQNVTSAFDAIANAAGDAKTQIEKLGDALKGALQQSLGPEIARDQLEGMVNNTLKSVNEIKDRGNLGKAQDFSNYSEDALKLRGDWQQMMQGMADDTVAWASSQKNLTGVQLAQYLQGQIDKMRQYGQEMGLTTGFVDHYVEALQKVITNGEVVTTFSANIDEAQGQVKAYLTVIGRTPEQIESIIKLMNADVSQAQIEAFLTAMGMTPEQVSTLMKVYVEEAAGKIQNYLNQLGDIDKKKVFETVVKLSAEVDPQAQAVLRGQLKDQGLNDDQINYMVNLLGDGFQKTEAIQKVLNELNGSSANPAVNLTDNASSRLNAIIGQLNNIRSGANANVTVTTTNVNTDAGKPSSAPKGSGGGPPSASTPQPRSAYGGIFPFADGGFVDIRQLTGYGAENHTAQIGTQGMVRMWNEPETGGEAYIPLSPNKRERSVAIWKEVGRRFGLIGAGNAYGSVLAFGGGGLLDGRLNSDDKKAKDAAKKVADDQKKAAETQKKAAEDQAKAGEEARRHNRSVWDYKFEIEGSMGPIDKVIALMGQMRELPAYSDEWMDVGRSIHEVMKSMEQDAQSVQDTFYDMGAISGQQYLGLLEERAGKTKAWTKEWADAGKKVYEQRRKIIEDRRDVEDALYDSGFVSPQKRIDELRARLGEEKAWSKEWLKLHNDIRSEEDKFGEVLNKYGGMTSQDYMAMLRGRLAETQKYSDRWVEITDKLAEMEKAGLTKIADMYGKFGDKQVVSTGNMISWLERQVKMGQKWADTISALKGSGAYSQGVISQLVEAGPASAGLANALLRAVGAGQSGTIQGLLDQAKMLGINTQSYDSGGYLPPGYTLAYNGTGRRESVGGGDINVVLPNAQITSPADADRMANRLGFAINSARA